MHISIDRLRKSFPNGVTAVDDLTLQVERGELISLLGPSGCGKTTTLRCIAGLENADSGSIRVADRLVFSRGDGASVTVPPENRKMAMVFQQYALWPHYDVFENVAFGLRSRRLPKAELEAKVEVALRRVRLWDHRERRISQLSGGQQQRVALARAFAPDPDIILFDEPLSNLDARLREGMRLELLEMQRSMGFTAIYVTHDQEEAFNLSSRIAVMNAGRIEQLGTPTEVWHTPGTAFVADFLGSTNRLRGTIAAGEGKGLTLVTSAGTRIDLGPRPELAVGTEVDAFVRYGSVRVLTGSPAKSKNSWTVPVVLRAFHGENVLMKVGFDGSELTCRTEQWSDSVADEVRIEIPPESILCFPAG
jgi:ABC-type Fe3+/spermidine/putrescine transport system ATPase subunit